jgi:HNH endonuclease
VQHAEDLLSEPWRRHLIAAILSERSHRVGSGCIEWTRARTAGGYGRFYLKGLQAYSHRIAWIVKHGRIPAGMCVCHKCDNPPCLNPDHLFLGTHKDNIRDASRKGLLPGNRTMGSAKPQAKLNEHSVALIRELRLRGASVAGLSTQFNISKSQMRRVVNGYSWKHVDTRSATR